MNAPAVRNAVFRFCVERRLMAVTECEINYATGRSDVIGIQIPRKYGFHTPVSFLYDFEVKVAKADLLADPAKRKWKNWGKFAPTTHFVIAVPADLEATALEVATQIDAKIHKTLKGANARGRTGVLVCDTEFRYRMVRDPVRFITVAPQDAVNRVLGRSLWELHNMRPLPTPVQQRRQDVLTVGTRWKEIRGRRVVEIVGVGGDSVVTRTAGTTSTRTYTSKIAGFCSRYAPSR